MTLPTADRSGATRVVDVHAHYLAPEVVAQLQDGRAAPHVTVREAGDDVRFGFPTTTSRVLDPKMSDLDNRIDHLDQCGIDVQILSTWIDMFGYDLPEEVAAEYHGWINEGLAAAVARLPERLRFLASVPLPWGDAAAETLRDSVERLGAVGAMIGTNVAGRNLDDPALDPFWSSCVQLGVPVELHPVAPAGSERLADHELANFLGNPFDTTVAAASMIFGGVLDRHPALDVVLVHGGGYLPHALGRMTHGHTARGVAPTLRRTPAAYLDRFHLDTIVYDSTVLAALAGLVGVDRLLIGSDYPFDMEPHDILDTVRSALGASSLDEIADATERLFGPLGGR